MKPKSDIKTAGVILGIEGGGTRTVALAVDGAERVLQRQEAGPANLILLTDAQLRRQFRFIRSQMPVPNALAIGLAGARTDADRNRLRALAQAVWPGVPCYATSDLETGLMAANRIPGVRTSVLIVSGTGACCFGKNSAGTTVRVGGWGHVLGDQGSGYDIGLSALKAVIHHYDCNCTWSVLGQNLLRALQLNDPEELVGWIQGANKTDVAALAVEVFGAAAKRDKIAAGILAGASNRLATEAVACARRLTKRNAKVQFILAGSVLLKQPAFASQVSRTLKRLWPEAIVTKLQRESVWGAIELARINAGLSGAGAGRNVLSLEEPAPARVSSDLEQLLSSPTEQRNPRSMNLDRLSVVEAVKLMLTEESHTPQAVLAEAKSLANAIDLVVRAFQRGGRLFYLGAGTSGRLGVLDASECPPTFNTDPAMVQGIMAGGQRALWESVEGAEDDPGTGASAVGFRGVTRKDVVLGIAASGRTPYVWGALDEARRRGAATILLTFNPALSIPPQWHPNIVIAPNVGPEVLTGSTRLKAGTATKLVLNAITTLAMVQLGKVQSNLMIDVRASNDKLRDRAIRILQQLIGVNYQKARTVLERTGWNIKVAGKLLGR